MLLAGVAILVVTGWLAAATGDHHAGESWPFYALQGKRQSVPSPLRRAAEATLGKAYNGLGLRFTAAHRLNTRVGIPIWVIPGRKITCLFRAQMVAVACDDDDGVRHRGLFLVVGEGKSRRKHGMPARFAIFGLVPNWSKKARLKILGGKSVMAPVTGNTFAYRATMPIEVKQLIR